jgi:hypothetical protein
LPHGYVSRLSFLVSHSIHAQESKLDFVFQGLPVSILSSDDRPLMDAHKLAAISRGHETEAAARQFGEAMKVALLAAGVEARLGVDVGKELPAGGPDQYLLVRSRQRVPAVGDRSSPPLLQW